MSLAILFHFLCAQHVSDINVTTIRSLRLFCWITTLVVLFLVRYVLEIRCGWVGVDTTPTQPYRISNTHRTKNNTTNVVIQQNSRKLLMMDILISETCLAHKKWNKIAGDIKLVFYSSTLRKIVHEVGTIYKIIQGCRSTKHKKCDIPVVLNMIKKKESPPLCTPITTPSFFLYLFFNTL